MATKIEIVQSIFEIDNKIREFKGEEKIDFTNREVIIRMEMMAHDKSKAWLNTEYEKKLRLYEDLQFEKKVSDYYQTPEGSQLKERLLTQLEEVRRAGDKEYKQTFERIEEYLQIAMGKHWGIKRFCRGGLEIAVIDFEKSTDEKRAFHFGQEIPIRFEDYEWLKGEKEEVYEANCCSAGSFDMEGGHTIGERAAFYVGVGRFFDNSLLIKIMKDILKEYADNEKIYKNQHKKIENQLANPFTETKN